MKNLKFALVTFVVIFSASNLNSVSAQLPDAGTSSSPTVQACMPLAGQICTPTPTTTTPPPTRVRRRVEPRPHACIWGNLREPSPEERRGGHDRLRMVLDDLDLGDGELTTDVGFGGICDCPEGFSPRPPASGMDSNIDVEDAAHRRIDRENSMQCVPIGSGSVRSVDFGPIESRLENDERTLFIHMCSANYPNVTWEEWRDASPARRNELCPDVDPAQQVVIDNSLETQYRFDCIDKMDEVSFQRWESASPADRVRLCPPRDAGTTIVNNGNGVFDNLDISLDAGANLFRTGISARSVEGFGALQFTLWPSTNARLAPTLRIRAGGGRMNDEGGIEIRHPVRLTVGVGAQVLLNKRLRLDVLVTTAAIWSSNTNSSELGDGLRARNGIGGEAGLTVNLNRASRSLNGVGLMPYVRFDAEVMSLQYNLLNDNAQNGFVRRTSLGGGLAFGVRWGLLDRHH